jgi:hypothetical protein
VKVPARPNQDKSIGADEGSREEGKQGRGETGKRRNREEGKLAGYQSTIVK